MRQSSVGIFLLHAGQKPVVNNVLRDRRRFLLDNYSRCCCALFKCFVADGGLPLNSESKKSGRDKGVRVSSSTMSQTVSGRAGVVGQRKIGDETSRKGREKACRPPQEDVTNIQQQKEKGGFTDSPTTAPCRSSASILLRQTGSQSWRVRPRRRNGKIINVPTLFSSSRRGDGGICLRLVIARERTSSHSRTRGGSRDERERTRLRRSLQHPPASRAARNPSPSHRKPSLDASDGLHRAKHCCSERFVLYCCITTSRFFANVTAAVRENPQERGFITKVWPYSFGAILSFDFSM